MSKKQAAKKKDHKMVKIGKGMKIKRGEEKKLEKKPGGSNVGKYKNVKKSDFAGTSGGSPKGSYPINTLARGKSALKLAHNAPNPAGIRSAVFKKYPQLKKGKKNGKK